MNPRFTDEQVAFRKTVSSVIQGHWSVEPQPTGGVLLREGDLYKRLVELGATALPTEQDRGVLFEEAGRRLAGAVLMPTVGQALPLLEEVAPGHWLREEAIQGQSRPVVCAEAGGPVVMAEATHVLHISAEGEVRLHRTEECRVRPAFPTDPVFPISQVSPRTAGEQIGVAASNRWRIVASIAAVHELLGLAQACLEMAIAYASLRRQFGRPVGSFQAISHRCAEMYLAIESTRAHAYFAAWAVQEGRSAASTRMAAQVAERAALQCAEGAIQIHGAIGFTWEHPVHLYLRRVLVLRACLASESMIGRAEGLSEPGD
jgi:hypothetical protein